MTAELTITTDEQGPHAIPHLIDGIPVQIKAVNVLVNREHFTFNPTNCSPHEPHGHDRRDEGATSAVSIPSRSTNCAVAEIHPDPAGLHRARRRAKSGGTSLHFKIAYPKGAMGSQSWMKEMKFDIPKQLPARLTTIQKACLAADLRNTNAQSVPGGVGHRPSGRAHGGPARCRWKARCTSSPTAARRSPTRSRCFTGYGLTIESHGHTFINGKTGVTSATFESVPDVPFESIEVTVPQGPFSEFGANLPAKANDNFCGQKLVMPIRFKAQNGLEIVQNTPVGVTGCKTLTRAQKLDGCPQGLPQETQQAQARSLRTSRPQILRREEGKQRQASHRQPEGRPMTQTNFSSSVVLTGRVQPPRRRTKKVTFAVVLVTFLVLPLACFAHTNAAFAARGHEPCPTCKFTPAGKEAFSEPTEIAVNEANKDLYVVDKGKNRIEYFTEKGEYQGEITGPSATGEGTPIEGTNKIELVSASEGHFIVGEEIKGAGIPEGAMIEKIPAEGSLEISGVVEPGATGPVPLTAHQSFLTPETIAVDNSCELHLPKPLTGEACEEFDPSNGDVYVGQPAVSAVDKFTATGVYVAQATGITNQHGITVDTHGVLYVITEETSEAPGSHIPGRQNQRIHHRRNETGHRSLSHGGRGGPGCGPAGRPVREPRGRT